MPGLGDGRSESGRFATYQLVPLIPVLRRVQKRGEDCVLTAGISTQRLGGVWKCRAWGTAGVNPAYSRPIN